MTLHSMEQRRYRESLKYRVFKSSYILPELKSPSAPLPLTPRALWRKLTLKSQSNFCKMRVPKQIFRHAARLVNWFISQGVKTDNSTWKLHDVILVLFGCLLAPTCVASGSVGAMADFTGGRRGESYQAAAQPSKVVSNLLPPRITSWRER